MHKLRDVDSESLQEELETCKHFLVDFEIENERHRVFNFAIDSLNLYLLSKKLKLVFDSLKPAAKLKAALGFVFKTVEDGGYRYYYAHGGNTLMGRSKLVAAKAGL